MSWQIQIFWKGLWAHETEHPTNPCFHENRWTRVTLSQPNELCTWARDTVSGYPILTAVNLLLYGCPQIVLYKLWHFTSANTRKYSCTNGQTYRRVILSEPKFLGCINIKTESVRKLSNFNFQWTKTLYQNYLKRIAFFFSFFKG